MAHGWRTQQCAAAEGHWDLMSCFILLPHLLQPPTAGDWVLVHAAAGGTGQLLTQIVSNLGGRVIGTTSTPEKAEVARSFGAQEVRPGLKPQPQQSAAGWPHRDLAVSMRSASFCNCNCRLNCCLVNIFCCCVKPSWPVCQQRLASNSMGLLSRRHT